jgi:octaprenyl-diphosphate synthase
MQDELARTTGDPEGVSLRDSALDSPSRSESGRLDAGAGIDAIVAPVHEDLIAVERALREGVHSIAPLVTQIGEHVFSGGGKRVRPALVLLSAQLCGHRGPRAIQIAAAAEHLHSATLVHDDVVDGAEVRRGRPTAHARFGAKLSVLVGDFLYAVCCQMLVDDGNPDVLAVFAESIRSLAEGEVLQLSRSFDPEIPESVYLQVVGRKTASLIAACSESGAILAGVAKPERRALREYGWDLGMAFQLVDDALDYLGTGEEMGKAHLSDAAEGKVTLPLILALRRAAVGEREAALSALKQLAKERAGVAEPEATMAAAVIAEVVTRHGGGELALERARAYARAAAARIETFRDCPAKQSLVQLAEFVVDRRT